MHAGNRNLVEVVNMQAAELKGNLVQTKAPGQKNAALKHQKMKEAK